MAHVHNINEFKGLNSIQLHQRLCQFYLVFLGRKKWSLHKSNGKGDNLPNEGIYRAKEFDTTWAGPGGGKVHIF